MYHPDTFPFQPPGKSKACCSSCEDGHGCEGEKGRSLWRFPDEGSYARGAWRATDVDASFSFGRRGLPDEPDFYQRGNVSLGQAPVVSSIFEEESYSDALENVYPVEPFEEQPSCDGCDEQAYTETYMPPDKALKLEALQSQVSFEPTRPGLGLPDEFGGGAGRFRPLSPTPEWPKGYALTPSWPNSDERLDFLPVQNSYELFRGRKAALLENAPVLTKIGLQTPPALKSGYDCSFIDSYSRKGNVYKCISKLRVTGEYLPGGTGTGTPERSKPVGQKSNVKDEIAYYFPQNLIADYIDNYITKKHPRTYVGSYLAGTNCSEIPRTKHTPLDIFNCSALLKSGAFSSGLLTKNKVYFSVDIKNNKNIRPYFDLHNKSIRSRIASLIILNFVNRRSLLRKPDRNKQLRFAILDNVSWVPPGYTLQGIIDPAKIPFEGIPFPPKKKKILEDTGITFRDIMDFLKEIRTGLNSSGIKLLPNMGQLSSLAAYLYHRPSPLKELLEVVDGVHIERPFEPATPTDFSARRTLDRMLNEIYVYKQFLQQGKAVFWIDYQARMSTEGTIYNSAPPFRNWLAGLAMLIRAEGESLFVMRPSFEGIKGTNEWSYWPGIYGKPVGLLFCQKGTGTPYPCPSFTGDKPPGSPLLAAIEDYYSDNWSMKRKFQNGRSIVVQSVTKPHDFSKKGGRFSVSFPLGFTYGVHASYQYQPSSLPSYGKLKIADGVATVTFDLKDAKELKHFMDGFSLRVTSSAIPGIYHPSFAFGMGSHQEESDLHVLITLNTPSNYKNIKTYK